MTEDYAAAKPVGPGVTVEGLPTRWHKKLLMLQFLWVMREGVAVLFFSIQYTADTVSFRFLVCTAWVIICCAYVSAETGLDL